MTFEKLWEQVEAQNPTMKTAKVIRMTEEKFKKAMMLAYTQGSKMATGAAEGLLKDLIKNGKEVLGKGAHIS